MAHRVDMYSDSNQRDDAHTMAKIMDAALDLFYYQGFRGTSVRQIAKHAGVNISLISYYYGGKKGLLEQIMIEFYEGYFARLHYTEEQLPPSLTIDERLLHMLEASMDYLFESYQRARFIYREISMDSMLIREVMTIYMSREKHVYMSVLEQAQQEGVLRITDLDIVVLQLLHALYMPFLQTEVIREVYYVEPTSNTFKKRYMQHLRHLVQHLFLK